MTQETDQLSSLHQWWNNISFDGKEDYQLSEKGELILIAKNGHKERVVGTLQAENADVIFRTLTEKFTELEARVKELQNDWNTVDDKLKLHSLPLCPQKPVLFAASLCCLSGFPLFPPVPIQKTGKRQQNYSGN